MRLAATLVATVALTAACAGSSQTGGDRASTAGGHPAVFRISVRDLPQVPAHGPAAPLSPPAVRVDCHDAVTVATHAVATGLLAQGVEVLDIGATTRSRSADLVTVRVAATHQLTGRDTAHTSIYELALRLGAGGRWEVVGSRTIQ